MIVNYKVLQAAFTKNGISKVRAVRWHEAGPPDTCALVALANLVPRRAASPCTCSIRTPHHCIRTTSLS